MLAQGVLARIGQPLQAQLMGSLAVESPHRPVRLLDLPRHLGLGINAALLYTARSTDACRRTRRDELWLLETGVADGIDGRAIDLVANPRSSSDASCMLPASTSGRCGATVAVAEVLLEGVLVGLGDIALGGLEVDLASKIADCGGFALLRDGFAVGVGVVGLEIVGASCAASVVAAALGPALTFGVGVIADVGRVENDGDVRAVAIW